MANKAIYPSLKGKTVLITGGAGGIGAHMVRAFLAQQAKTAFIGRREDNCREFASEFKGQKNQPLYRVCDLRDVRALEAAMDSLLEELGVINVLVNNAARDQRVELNKITPEVWDEQMNVNLRHHFFCAQKTAPGMARCGGGSIINVGSICWMKLSGGVTPYATGKAAILGLTRSLARELGPDKIRVNCLVPGWVLTERQVDLWGKPPLIDQVYERQCLKEIIKPDDVADLALWLAADDSRMCTGQNFIIDAGVV